MGHRAILLWAGIGLLAGFFAAGCGGTNANVSVAITSPGAPPTIDQGQTVNVVAKVSSSIPSTSPNVTWTLSGNGCIGSACGSLTNETSTAATYNAPSMAASNFTVSLTATSVADTAKSASIQITVAAIAVAINNKVTQQAAGSATDYFTQFSATVQNDPGNAGVTWTLTAGGSSCSPACGTLSMANTFAVEYVPPTSAPASPANMPTLTATSITNTSESDTDQFTIIDGSTACGTRGNEGVLKGQYAIMLQGWSGAGTGTPIIYAASFAADGTGKITSGQDQYNPYSSFAYGGSALIASASSYSVGADNRGCLTLTDNYVNTFTLHFSLGGVSSGISGNGDIILDGTDSVTPLRGSGILRLQDPSAFSVSALAANYAFGVDGWDQSSGSLEHFALAGSFGQSGGNLYNLAFNLNDGGSISNSGPQPGNFGTIPTIYTATGTNTVTLNLPGTPTDVATVTIYQINSSEFFFVSITLGNAGPEFCGRAIASPNTFNGSLISPDYIFRLTGYSSGSASAAIGQASFSGGATGSVSGTFDQYASATASSQSISGTYVLDSSSAGRLVVSGASAETSPACFLTTPFDDVAGFCVTADASASFGVLDTQPAATYGTSSVSGNFYLGTSDPGDNTVSDISGTVSISAGSVSGTEDTSAPTGVTLGTPLSATLSVNSDGTGNLAPNTVMVTNGTELYFINEANNAPAQVQVFEP